MPIPALGILGAAAISAIGGALMNRRAEKVAQRNAEQQRKWQLEDRAHEEAYNDPQAQLARFRAAGINPMNSGSIGVGESAFPNAPAIDSVDYTNPGEAIAQGVSNMADYQMQQKDMELRRDQLELDKKKVDSEIKKTESDIAVNKTVEDLNKKLGIKSDEEAKVIREQFNELHTKNKYLDDMLYNQLEQAGIDLNEKKLAYKFNYDTLNDRMEAVRLQNKKLRKEIDELASRIGVNKATAAYTYGKLKELNLEIAYGMPYWKARSVMYGAKEDGVEYNLMLKGYDTQRAIQAKEKGDAEFMNSDGVRWTNLIFDKIGGLLTTALSLYGGYKLGKSGKIVMQKPGFDLDAGKGMTPQEIQEIQKNSGVYIPGGNSTNVSW